MLIKKREAQFEQIVLKHLALYRLVHYVMLVEKVSVTFCYLMHDNS